MNYTYDSRKVAANVEKHGVWLQEAKSFEWENALIKVDDRKQYEETRFEAIGYIDERLHVMLFCLCETAVRIISLRKALKRGKTLCQNLNREQLSPLQKKTPPFRPESLPIQMLANSMQSSLGAQSPQA